MEYDSFCDNCGNRVPFNAHVCPYCRKEFEAIQCPACGYQGKPAEFLNGCPSCGFMQSQDIVFPEAKPSKGGIQNSGEQKRQAFSETSGAAQNSQDGAFGFRNPYASKPYQSRGNGAYGMRGAARGNNSNGKRPGKKQKYQDKQKYEEAHIPNWVAALIIGLLGIVLFILFMVYLRLY